MTGDRFSVSYTTATKIDKGVCVEIDKPVVIKEKEKWIILDNGETMPFREFVNSFRIKEFKKL